jgi:hypothetical protein
MIFSLLIIHNHDRMSSITRVLHTTTWDYFTSHLPGRFSRSPKVVKEAIMAHINDLAQDFWRTSSDGADGAPFFEMRRLLENFQNILDVCFVIISFLRGVDLLIKIYRWQIPIPLTTKSYPNSRYWLMGIEGCLISQFLNPKI